ncbi:MAG: hypothetical protein LBL47_04845 [Lactobacillus sp.]|jgi:hypothetical protein|nr:hypothetical protein [Lactobacillus sp.]
MAKSEMFYAVGDSHVSFFTGNELMDFFPYKKGINVGNDRLKYFKTYHLGPGLAYSANKYGSTTKTREKAEYLVKNKILPEGANVVLSLGGIDARRQVVKINREKGIDFQTIVDGIVDCYKDLLEYMDKAGFKLYCWGIVATITDEAVIETGTTVNGDEATRNRITMMINDGLKRICEENGWNFVSVAEATIDENFKTREDLICTDRSHLSQIMAPTVAKEFEKYGVDILARKSKLEHFVNTAPYYIKRKMIKILSRFILVKKWRKKFRSLYQPYGPVCNEEF